MNVVSITDIVPKRVAITQLGSIRDCLLTVPLAVDVKNQWPHATVVWLVESGVAPLLETHSCIDEIIRMDCGWTRQVRGWREVWRKLRSLEIDVAMDPMGLTKSAVLAMAAGAKTRIGFAPPLARELAPWFYTHRISASLRHRLDANRELMRPWREPQAGGGKFEMPSYQPSTLVNQFGLKKMELVNSNNWYVIHPGALWPTGCWPVERFGSVAREVYERYGWRAVIVWLGESERLLSEVVVENSGGVAITSPELNLLEMIQLLRQSQFLISGDSVVLHLASSVSVPSVSLHGPTWGDEFGAYGQDHIAIQSPHPNLTRRTHRRGANTSMQAIDVDEVVLQVNRLVRRLSLNEHAARNVA